MATDPQCKAIGEAVVGVSNKVGCSQAPLPPLPTFPTDARKTDSTVKTYKYKLRKSGLLI